LRLRGATSIIPAKLLNRNLQTLLENYITILGRGGSNRYCLIAVDAAYGMQVGR
jgi:hypothetical protein